MAGNNAFRFVSVRPPTTAPAEDLARIDPPDWSTDAAADRSAWVAEITDSIRQARGRGGLGPLDAAREEVGTAMIRSDKYYTADPAWTALLKAWPRLGLLVDAAAEDRKRAEFVTRVEALLKELLPNHAPDNLADWIASPDFDRLRTSVWRSYIANVLAPSVRPGDREELVAAIRFLHLVESASGQKRFAGVAATVRRARPAVPAELFVDTATLTAPDERPSRPESDRLETGLVDRLERLEVSRNQLRRLFRSRPRRIVPSLEAVEEGEPQDVLIGGERLVIRTGGTRGEAVEAWRIADDELANNPELGALLDELEIAPGVTIPDAVAGIEAAMAVTIADIAAHRRRPGETR